MKIYENGWQFMKLNEYLFWETFDLSPSISDSITLVGVITSKWHHTSMGQWAIIHDNHPQICGVTFWWHCHNPIVTISCTIKSPWPLSPGSGRGCSGAQGVLGEGLHQAEQAEERGRGRGMPRWGCSEEKPCCVRSSSCEERSQILVNYIDALITFLGPLSTE